MKYTIFMVLTLSVAIAFAFAGCGERQPGQVTLQVRSLSRLNPTDFEFAASISEVTNAISRAFGMDSYLAESESENHERAWKGNGDATARHLLTLALQQPPPSLFFKGDADSLSRNLLTEAGNENDAYLFGSTSSIGESQVYFRDGSSLIYYADFHIHLTTVSPKRTRVEIFTYGSRVVAGVDESWSPHGPSFIYVEVPPTTVEQYQILMKIGRKLGVTNMPPLEVPGPDAPVKELKLMRER